MTALFLRQFRWVLLAAAFACFTTPAFAQTYRLRLVAANLTSGNNQSYTPGEGARILDWLNPDVVMIQEFNYLSNSASDIQTFVTNSFGASFSYFREGGAQIPNGIISRYPILASGEWDDPYMTNRDFAYARIDIPGAIDLWAVSVHLASGGGPSERNDESISLVDFINSNVPQNAFLAIGGDFNADTRSETFFSHLDDVVVVTGPYPAGRDANGNLSSNTNSSRAKPYDGVYVDGDLSTFSTSVVIGNSVFANGLVADTRYYTPTSELAPALVGDSGATNMQHMAVVRDFLVPAPVPEPQTVVLLMLASGALLWRRRCG